jgi:two-component system NtrC family sensor kinase
MINATQAMDSGGTLGIETGAETRDGVPGAVISVADSGPGIAPDRLATVFDPFFTTKPGEGTGLGLSISQTLVNQAGGLITVANRETGGAQFFVWCPAADI